MAGQPNTSDWVFDLQSIDCHEFGGIGPCIVINRPHQFQLTSILENKHALAGVIIGQRGNIMYYCRRLEDGAMVTLPPAPFAKDATAYQPVPSPAYDTVPAPAAGALHDGTWSVTAVVVFDDPNIRSKATGFNQTYIQVAPPLPPP